MSHIVTNSKARRDYHILDTVEAGLVLRGTEVKAVRAGMVQIQDAFAKVQNDELWLHQSRIDEYRFGNRNNHAPQGVRKLLLHKREIRKLKALAEIKGHTLVALDLHWKDGRVKVLLGVAKGKQDYDKRQDVKRRDMERDMRQAMTHRAERGGGRGG